MANIKNQHSCPFCGSKVLIRSSEMLSPKVKRLYGQCQNLDCGWTGTALQEWVFTNSPSAIQNDSMNIPFSPSRIPKEVVIHDKQARSSRGRHY